jgi:RecJ-like exonuclease
MTNAERALENYNIAADSRSRSLPGTVLYIGDEEKQLPVKWVLCPVCEGKGRHVNPAIDAGGISDEMYHDDDFHEQYAAGVYDIPCNICKGRTTVQVVDTDRLTIEEAALYEIQLREEADDEAERLAEIRMGC